MNVARWHAPRHSACCNLRTTGLHCAGYALRVLCALRIRWCAFHAVSQSGAPPRRKVARTHVRPHNRTHTRMYVFPPMHACGYARTYTRADRHIYLICARAPTNARIHARIHTDTRSCTNTERTELALAPTHNANARTHSFSVNRSAARQLEHKNVIAIKNILKPKQRHSYHDLYSRLADRPDPSDRIGRAPLSARTPAVFGCVRVARQWVERVALQRNRPQQKHTKYGLRPAARTQHARANARAHTHACTHACTHTCTRTCMYARADSGRWICSGMKVGGPLGTW